MENSETYRLTVPLAQRSLSDYPSRYGCCHRSEEVGHSDDCTQEMRVKDIERVLAQAGFEFERECDVAKSLVPELLDPLVSSRAAPSAQGTVTGRISCLGPNPNSSPRGPVDLALAARAEASIPLPDRGFTDESLFREQRIVEALAVAKRTGHVVMCETQRGGAVNHPDHYNQHPAGIECVDVIEHMASNVASAMKYLWRAGLKPGQAHDQDLAKAIWYIERERERAQRLEAGV